MQLDVHAVKSSANPDPRIRVSTGLADPVAWFSSGGQEPGIGATTKKRYLISHVSEACTPVMVNQVSRGVEGRFLDSGGPGLSAATEQTLTINWSLGWRSMDCALPEWRNEMVRISSFFPAVIDSKESAKEVRGSVEVPHGMQLGSRLTVAAMISHMGVDRCRTVVSFQDKGD
ncbi:hypothetical protein NE237_017555 [Protea cynaroides]|uniref:Uncharacterized protein n=1 Tax=Protea cynaroides TaxID=273540 RepID=A0A9Q0K8A7_9MAGN|nr:hypothetical protein NE237_017555 [Protea cynaroides]